jgi:acetylornithine deacetylase/succinyl-diaminopimelate desuccinylase-like protein
VGDVNRTEVTYKYERIRAVANGMLEMGGSTFLLLIALKWLHAGVLKRRLWLAVVARD